MKKTSQSPLSFGGNRLVLAPAKKTSAWRALGLPVFCAALLTGLVACGGGSGSSDTAKPAAATTSQDCMAKRNSTGHDVVLLIGQSNMSGYGAYYVEGFDKTDPRINQWTRSSKIELAVEPLDHPQFPYNTGRIGPGLSFGRAYLNDLPANRSVLLVPAAWGGTGFSTGAWNPGDSLYEEAVQRTKAALAQDPGNCMAAILWSQGEIDAINKVSEADYRKALFSMIGGMRARLASGGDAGERIPFILGQFSPDWTGPVPTAEQQAILNVINQTPNMLPTTAIASTAGLTSNVTQGLDAVIHLDAASQRIYGTRFRESLKTAVANGPK